MQDDMRPVLVTGATGFLGGRVVAALRRDGGWATEQALPTSDPSGHRAAGLVLRRSHAPSSTHPMTTDEQEIR